MFDERRDETDARFWISAAIGPERAGALDKDIVHSAASPIHEDLDAGRRHPADEGRPRPLRAMIRVEDLWPPEPDHGVGECGEAVGPQPSSLALSTSHKAIVGCFRSGRKA